LNIGRIIIEENRNSCAFVVQNFIALPSPLIPQRGIRGEAEELKDVIYRNGFNTGLMSLNYSKDNRGLISSGVKHIFKSRACCFIIYALA
jgi:hypothetical protein